VIFVLDIHVTGDLAGVCDSLTARRDGRASLVVLSTDTAAAAAVALMPVSVGCKPSAGVLNSFICGI